MDAAFASPQGRASSALAAFAPFASGSPLFLRASQLAPPRASPGRAPPRRLTADEAGELAYAFDRLSAGQADAATGEPLATPRQLKLTLRALGFPVKKADVRGLLRDAGLDADAPLARADFLEVAGGKLLERGRGEEVARAFELFDLSGAGRVGPGELRAIAKQLGVEITPDEVRDMIDEFDGDGDGCIDAADFAAIMAAADE